MKKTTSITTASSKKRPHPDASPVTSVPVDDRFRALQNDPRFSHAKPSSSSFGKKVVVDERFKDMFESKDFEQKHSKVDKFGRKKQPGGAEGFTDLKKYYALDKGSAVRLEELNRKARGEDESGEEEEEEASSSSESSFSGEEEEEEEVEEEKIAPAEFGTESSKRLAVVGCDWDHVRSVDLLAMLGSFVPSMGAVLNVTVYPSEFGKQRMAIEEVDGPFAAQNNGVVLDNDRDEDAISNDDDDDQDEEGADQGFDPEKLRKYEKDRLLYYFGVITCDSVATAETIYRECDGTEFEHSSVAVDLRFIPDGVKFNSKDVRDFADTVPETYAPLDFVNKTLQQSRVELSWDEPDHDRRKLENWNKASSKSKDKSIPLSELEAFIASDDSHDESADEDDRREKNVERYRALLTKSNDNNVEDNFFKDEAEDEVEEGEEMARKNMALKTSSKTASKGKSNKKSAAEEEQDDIVFEDDKDFGDLFGKKKTSKKDKKKKSKSRLEDDEEGNVVLDVNDNRFASLYDDPEYSLDRTDPRFKSTDTTKKIDAERRKRWTGRD